MIIDKELTFSDAQALTQTAGSTNVIDLGEDRNIGIGEPMGAVIIVDVAADATTGDETYQFDLQTGATSSPATTIASRVIAAASLTAGSKHVIPVPPDTSADRYLDINYVLGGTTPTITVTAFLQPLSMIQNDVNYPNNITSF